MSGRVLPVPPETVLWAAGSPDEDYEWIVSGYSIYARGDLPEDEILSERQEKVVLKSLDWMALPSRESATLRVDKIRDALREHINPRAHQRRQLVRVSVDGVFMVVPFDEERPDWLPVNGTYLWRLLHGWTDASVVTVSMQTVSSVPILRIQSDDRFALLAAVHDRESS